MRENVKFNTQCKCKTSQTTVILMMFCVKKCNEMTHFDSVERVEHRLRLTVTLGPRSLPRRCSGSPKSWWRHSDRVRLMSHFSVSEMACGSWSSLPTEAWPLWSRPLPRSVMESLCLTFWCIFVLSKEIIYRSLTFISITIWWEIDLNVLRLFFWRTVSNVWYLWTIVCLQTTLHVYKGYN